MPLNPLLRDIVHAKGDIESKTGQVNSGKKYVARIMKIQN